MDEKIEGYRNGAAFMRANVERYGVREGTALMRDAQRFSRYTADFAAGMCDALIQGAQERSI